MAENKAQNTQKNTQKKDADRKKDARNRKRMGNQREIWLSAGSIGGVDIPPMFVLSIKSFPILKSGIKRVCYK